VLVIVCLLYVLQEWKRLSIPVHRCTGLAAPLPSDTTAVGLAVRIAGRIAAGHAAWHKVNAMRRSKRPLYEINFRLAVVWLALSLLTLAGCSTTTPPLTPANTVSADPQLNQILATSCYGCHTGEGNSQWYAKLEPTQWFNGEALEELNFSDWHSYGALRRKALIGEIAAAVKSGSMPPAGYTLFHPDTRLSAEQKETIAQWAAQADAIPAH
jgi:mono/diheme cytochrome c family protein